MVNLLPSLSLKVHSYPECIGEVSWRYKSTAAESRMRSRQWELHHCSIVYTVVPYLCPYHLTWRRVPSSQYFGTCCIQPNAKCDTQQPCKFFMVIEMDQRKSFISSTTPPALAKNFCYTNPHSGCNILVLSSCEWSCYYHSCYYHSKRFPWLTPLKHMLLPRPRVLSYQIWSLYVKAYART